MIGFNNIKMKELLKERKRIKKKIEQYTLMTEILPENVKSLEEMIHRLKKEQSEKQTKIQTNEQKLNQLYVSDLNDVDAYAEVIHGTMTNLQVIANELNKKDVKKQVFESLKTNLQNYIIGTLLG